MEEAGISRIGISWYKREQYGAIRALMTDGGNLPVTYDAWLQAAETLLARTRGRGMRAVIDADEFRAWCKARRIRPNGDARRLWANKVVAEAAGSAGAAAE
ncbi:hypothetical protein [Longimicrobium terrae]|uniref:Uncharacterized protein n=1 Tax=Longimicrobium terrae TaxID=1639882 RepID=A0A841GY87_9BACT|nr:hypothetical protein [Longimicrobium terrae]MBB4636293.1 hypothetical protein [Longimicrobium terrae]MBB6070689.1 hypothetical protein [Longimicrobium terrae]NNC29671.1 hypothetical protein [Longimicrobium terrae]